MRAMQIQRLGAMQPDQPPLDYADVPVPEPETGEVRIRVSHCGVCHTELDEIEGRTPPDQLPRIPGHQVVGTIDKLGTGVKNLKIGDRVGVAWIYSSCGQCQYCVQGDDNLCPEFKATGRDVDGGYAEYMCAAADYVVPIPENISSVHAAPLLCAGAIGYRSLRLTLLSNGEPVGMTGFGASAHLMLKMLQGEYPNSKIYVFARKPEEREFALSLGADWAGTTDERPPEPLMAIVDTTPAWFPVTQALRFLAPGGRLVINAIRKEAGDREVLSELDYESQLWMEKEIKSVANVARRDVREFLALASRLDIQPEYQLYSLQDANQALLDLRFRSVRGAKVLEM